MQCMLLKSGGEQVDGSVKCWGYNDHGQQGDGTIGTDRLTPVDPCGPDPGRAGHRYVHVGGAISLRWSD
jgi:hypothetical protein